MSLKNVQGSSDIANRSLTTQKRTDAASQPRTAQAPQAASVTISQATQSLAVFRAASSQVTEATVTSIRSFNQTRASTSDFGRLTDPDEATELAEDIANRILDGDADDAHFFMEGISKDLF